MVAISHIDLEKDLSPSITIQKGWAQEISVESRQNTKAEVGTVIREETIEEGTM